MNSLVIDLLFCVNRVAFGLLCLLVAPCSVPAQGASLFTDVRAAWHYDDNLNRAERDNQKEADSIFELDGIVGYRMQLADSARLVMSLGLLTDFHVDIDDLNAAELQARVDYLVQPTRGFTAPWYALSGSLSYRQHADSDIRDGAIGTLAVLAGRRFTDRIAAHGGYRYRDRRGEQGRVFDLAQHEIFVQGDYRVSRAVTAYLGYAYLTGDLTSTSRNPKFAAVATAVSPDPAFGFSAWRLDGHAHSLTIGSRFELNRHTGIDASLRYSKADADGHNQWHNTSAGLALLHRF